MDKKKDYGLIFWIHLIVNLVLYFSWILFSWWIILIGEIILQLQYQIFGGCVLTKAEFGKEKNDTSCIGYYLEKWNLIKKNTPKTKVFIRDISPWIIFALSVLWQLILGIRPLVF